MTSCLTEIFSLQVFIDWKCCHLRPYISLIYYINENPTRKLHLVTYRPSGSGQIVQFNYSIASAIRVFLSVSLVCSQCNVFELYSNNYRKIKPSGINRRQVLVNNYIMCIQRNWANYSAIGKVCKMNSDDTPIILAAKYIFQSYQLFAKCDLGCSRAHP